jgi:hypothetical protein
MEETVNTNESLLADSNCSHCLNELCIVTWEYELYKTYVSVDTFEMVLISLNIIVFMAGIIGNLLVRQTIDWL